jgi:hypothetical protein
MIGFRGTAGLSTVLRSVAKPDVAQGHVAGWIGLGAPGEGPGRTDEWLQVGLAGFPDGSSTLYYEVAAPGAPIRYVEIEGAVPQQSPRAVAILQVAGKLDTWRVWVNGRPVSDEIVLRGSTGRLTPMATAESWDGGAGACNGFAYRFSNVRAATRPGGVWRPFRTGVVKEDLGYRVVRSASSFLAATAALVPKLAGR